YYSAKYGSVYPEGTQLYDNMAAVLQTGHSMKHNLSVEAGNDRATLRAGASFLDQTGVIKTTDYNRTNLSLSGKAEITKWLKFEASMQYTKTSNNKVQRGTNGPLRRAMRWPMTDNMANWLDSDGMHMRWAETYTDTDLLNPLFDMYKNKYYDESDRFLSNASITINLPYNIFVRAQAGWDVGTQTFETSIHPYWSTNQEGNGSYNQAKSNFNDPTINMIAGWNDSFFEDKFTVNAQVGYHQVENGVNRLSTYGSKFAVVDFQSINNCDVTTITSKKRTTKRRVQAISAQAELGYLNQVFLTLRARNDWSSTLPKDNNSYFYPAAELAWVASDLAPFKNQQVVNYLKIRGSVAQVGKDASPLSIYPELEPTELLGGGYKYGFTGPNLNLKPEMTTSWEIGAETRLLNDRIAADFTYFHTHCADQIVNGFRLSYATGFVLNNLNVGTFNTWGWEGHIDGDIITGPGYRWNLGFNLSHTNSKVVYLPDNVTEYYNAYTWNSGNIRNGIMRGYPVTTLTGRGYERNEAGDILISPTTGQPLVSSEWSVIGNREPKLRFGITTSVNWKGFYLNAMFAGRFGATVVNGTKRDMLSSGMSMESVSLRESGSYVFNGVLKDGKENTENPTKNNIAVNMAAFGTSIYTGVDENWLEKNVNYLRCQELRLSYTVPSKALKKFLHGFVSNAMVYVSGNDLFTITNYSGIDAVGNTISASGGGTGGEGYDVWSIPNPRTFNFGISLTFN
ncbi:MAG: TonB-dependent receptor, partial [Muribaculaceae bacterium]|nr:TonB-dependent receptor [Muribaculaceae bacterium]